MFICEFHTNERLKNKAYEDLPYKKCPHCGVLGKPEPGKCNFLYCNGPDGIVKHIIGVMFAKLDYQVILLAIIIIFGW